MLECGLCGESFPRARTGSPARYCSKKCRNRAYHQRTYEAKPRKVAQGRSAKSLARKQRYMHDYMRRPEVRERYRRRYMWKWNNDPEFRNAERERMRVTIYPDITVATPYTGHRWLDMARQAVLGSRVVELDDSAPWADDYHDDMGVAVLALLEGRDMHEAIRENRKREYVPRNLTIHYGDFRDDDGEDRWFDGQMPTVPSAEDEYLDKEEPVLYYEATRFRDTSTRRRRMHHATSTPSNRRSNRR